MSLTDVEHTVLSYIRRNPGKSRTVIAAELGLSKSMLTKAVAKFDVGKLVVEERVTLDEGERGQPPISLSLNRHAFHSIGFYVREGSYVAVRTDLGGDVQQAVSGNMPAGADLIQPIIQDIAALVDASPAPVIGIGQAVPAIIGEDGTLFEITPLQSKLPLAELAQALRSHFDLPTYWDNGAYCIAAYEAQKPETNRRCVFYLTLDYGVGGGLVADGKVFRGGYNQAANIGALVPETGPRPNLADLARHLNFPLDRLTDDLMGRMFAEHDERLLTWIADRGAMLSRPLSTVVQMFNPDAIIVGGFFPQEVLVALCGRVDLGIWDTPGRRPLTKPPMAVTSLLGPAGLAEAAALLPISARLLGQRTIDLEIGASR